MSYDIYLNDPATGETLTLAALADIRGGTYAHGGTLRAWLNVTYNYSRHFADVLGPEGIRSLYGRTAGETIPILQAAADQLSGEPDPDYWAATAGNAKAALLQLVQLAQLVPPDAVWEGD